LDLQAIKKQLEMKKILFSLLIALPYLDCNAAEVELLCKGYEDAQMNNEPSHRTQKVAEISFDEKTKEITKFTARLGAGCFNENENVQPIKCECSVTPTELKCNSEVIGITNKNMKASDFFKINRKSGRMMTQRTQIDDTTSFFFTGEYLCEKFTSNKF